MRRKLSLMSTIGLAMVNDSFGVAREQPKKKANHKSDRQNEKTPDEDSNLGHLQNTCVS